MQRDGFITTLQTWWHRSRPEWRVLATRFALIGLSFCTGLVVFYLPGRHYDAVPEVWLPTAQSNNRDQVLALPVKLSGRQAHGVRLASAYPDGPEIVEINARKAGVTAADCPDFYKIEELEPSGCDVLGKVDGAKVYTITRELPSMNVNAYTMRGDTLIAITGVYSREDAFRYLGSFKKIAKRNVGNMLASNQRRADAVSQDIRQEKRADAKARAEAYKHLPFDPLLPASLPANWIQYSVRIEGDDPKHPDGVEVLYKKGRDRFVGYSMRASGAFLIDKTCGPTPTAGNGMLPCGRVPGEDYFSGGVSGADYASWYLYRQIGPTVAIMHVSVYADGGRQLLFSNEDLEAQQLLIKSLRPAGKDRLKGADFTGSQPDRYPNIRP